MKITDAEWQEDKEAGGSITKTVSYMNTKDGVSEKISVDVDILVLPALVHAEYQDALMNGNVSGEIDAAKAQEKLIQLSTGLSPQTIETIKRNKPMSFWQGLIAVCQEVNSFVTQDQEIGKDGEGEV